MNGSLPIARPRSYFLFSGLLLENYYENLFGFFIKPKRFARSRHGYISKHDETRVNLILFSLIQCIQCLKKGNEENEKYLQPSPPLSFIIVIPSPITGKEEGRHAGGRRRRIRNIWVSESSSPSFPTTANFQFLRQRASHIVGGNSCCNSVRWNEDRSKEWSNLRGGFVRWKAANNLMQIRGDLVGEVSGGRGERSAPPVR